uniref:Ras-related protein Rab-4A n=1 Tax=Daphnia magna TaxID=35525 RepID=A0A0P6DJG3_9CRUS
MGHCNYINFTVMAKTLNLLYVFYFRQDRSDSSIQCLFIHYFQFNFLSFLCYSRSVTKSYYRGAAGALLVYDISSRESYNAVGNWLTDAQNLANPNLVVLLVGNKRDLEEDRQVSFLEASQFAQENDLMFLEASALTGENVEEAFLQCAKSILSKVETGELDPNRLGSGIQHGETAIRRFQRQSSSTPSMNPPSCSGCKI